MSYNFPPQRTNPARDLYKMWYSLVKYHNPASLLPDPVNDAWWHDTAAFQFPSGHQLSVARPVLDGHKPALEIPSVMRIWPNGHFSVLGGAHGGKRYHNAMLDAYEKLTFLRWGYPDRRTKGLWVQDTPRMTWHMPGHRQSPSIYRWQERVPYLPLSTTDLFHPYIVYRLKFTTAWVIAAVGTHVPQGRRAISVSERVLKQTLKDAQTLLDSGYAAAEKRYDWHRRKAELAEIRASQAEQPRPRVTALDRVNLTQLLMQGMTVYEPKVLHGRIEPPQKDELPLDEMEGVNPVGNDVESRSVAG